MGRSGVGAGWGLTVRLGAVGCCCILLAQCGQAPSGRLDPKYGVSSSPRLVALGEPVPKGGGTYRVGKPYTIGDRTYEPQDSTNYTAEGLASWYGENFHGRATANGEIYDMTSISAAHPTLPIPSYVRVTNLANKKSIVVRVNDRGPYHADRLIDVSVRTAKLLDFYDRGATRVRVDYVGRAALEGSDDTKLAATLRSGTPAPGPSEVRMASSRPFVPQSAPPTREAAPIPTDRPFGLGDDETAARGAKRLSNNDLAVVTRQAIPRVTSQSKPTEAAAPPLATASVTKPEQGFAARFSPTRDLPTAPTGTASVSAFAGDAGPNRAVLTGRGLY